MSSIVAVLPFKNEMGHMADVVSSIPGEVEVICVIITQPILHPRR